ncbi:MAG: DMT family transporter [Bacteriovorax sp.]|nr:DMT family transporter [Bacteriovorax sp.]
MLINILLLLFSTSIWGFGFIATRWSLVGLDPFWVNGLRFAIAAICSLPFLIYKKSFTRPDNILKKSFISSVFLLGIMLFQTIGLTMTTVAKSGFITTLYALIIPIITMIVFKKKYKPTFWLLILLAMVGMALMCNLEVKDMNLGDFLTFICSVFAAVHIIYVGRVANHIKSPVEFNFLQNFFTAALSIPIAFIFRGPVALSVVFNPANNVLMGLLYLGIISSMISFTAQIIAQKQIPDHIAGLIFLTESPFAAFFGFMIFGELLNKMNFFGAGLIIISVVLVPVLGREVTAKVKIPRSH